MASSKAFLCIMVVVLVAAVFIQTNDAMLRNGKRSMLLEKLRENARRSYNGDYDFEKDLEDYAAARARQCKFHSVSGLICKE